MLVYGRVRHEEGEIAVPHYDAGDGEESVHYTRTGVSWSEKEGVESAV